MREILFRGKRTDNGEWIFGDLIENQGEYYIYQANSLTTLHLDDENLIIICAYRVDYSTVGQYTGLTDKNGRKVFEGDIVKTKYGRVCKVEWFMSQCWATWDLTPLESKNKAPDKWDVFNSQNLEVISNIYDNPELLKEA